MDNRTWIWIALAAGAYYLLSGSSSSSSSIAPSLPGGPAGPPSPYIDPCNSASSAFNASLCAQAGRSVYNGLPSSSPSPGSPGGLQFDALTGGWCYPADYVGAMVGPWPNC